MQQVDQTGVHSHAAAGNNNVNVEVPPPAYTLPSVSNGVPGNDPHGGFSISSTSQAAVNNNNAADELGDTGLDKSTD